MTRKITLEDTKIQAWSLDQLKPAENNHKRHTEESTAKLAKSMADIGQIQPVIVDKDGEIIAGHGRWMAAQKLGWSKIKVIQLPVDRATAIKARIADNLMSNQNIDHEKLATELNELVALIGEEDQDLGALDLGVMIIDDALAGLHDMRQSDDFGISKEAFSSNILQDVEEFTREGEEKMAAAAAAETPIRRVFGFANVNMEQARIIKDFMTQVMHETGREDPAEAFVSWVSEVLAE